MVIAKCYDLILFLQVLNIMHLHSPESAILSTVIFNAVIIPLLIPLALRGVTYKPIGASALLRRNLFIYGLGGIVAPFVGIKLIDILIIYFVSAAAFSGSGDPPPSCGWRRCTRRW